MEKLNLCVEVFISDLVYCVFIMGSIVCVYFGLGGYDFGGFVRYRLKVVGMIIKKVIQFFFYFDSGFWINFYLCWIGVQERFSLVVGFKFLVMIDVVGVIKWDLVQFKEFVEVIVLKKFKDEDDYWWGCLRGMLMNYQEIFEIYWMCDQMEWINVYISEFDFFIELGVFFVDFSLRLFKWIFMRGDFNSGGCFWGFYSYLFWYDLKVGCNGGINECQEYFLINGELVEEVDIKVCFLIIFYVLEGFLLLLMNNFYVLFQYVVFV